MINRLKFVFFLLLLLICSLPSFARADQTVDPPVRIKLNRFFPVGTGQVTISSNTPFTVTDPTGTAIAQAPSGAVYVFKDVAGTKVSIGSAVANQDSEENQTGTALSALCFTVHPSVGGTIAISTGTSKSATHRYRGEILILPGLDLVNTLPLEDYLMGVLDPEIGSGAPEEALKAQAIAARTYTMKNLGKMSLVGADLDDTTHSQGYVGADGETPSIVQAVTETEGKVLLYGGSLIDAVYSTDCGGTTAMGSASEPYLAPVQDPGCGLDPPWEVDLTADQVGVLLGEGIKAIPNKIDISVTQMDASGRVTELTISQGPMETQITGIQLRKTIGYDKLRSTLFKVTKDTAGVFHFVGQGWGHGLGLCQRGAIYLAQHSYLCDDILKHYYTGTTIAQLDPSMIVVTPVNQMATMTSRSSTRNGP